MDRGTILAVCRNFVWYAKNNTSTAPTIKETQLHPVLQVNYLRIYTWQSLFSLVFKLNAKKELGARRRSLSLSAPWPINYFVLIQYLLPASQNLFLLFSRIGTFSYSSNTILVCKRAFITLIAEVEDMVLKTFLGFPSSNPLPSSLPQYPFRFKQL